MNLLKSGYEVEEAWQAVPQILKDHISAFANPTVLELGGGRAPLLSLGEIAQLKISYVVNDVDPRELQMLSPDYGRACFDASDPPPAEASRYDIIFSKMFLEHVVDARLLHRKVYQMLKPGGICFHFAPKLFSVPLLANYVMPESWSRNILYKLQRGRSDEEGKKFPAHYSGLAGGSARVRAVVEDAGFTDVMVCPIWGHNYYRFNSMLSILERKVRRSAMRQEWSWWATSVFITAKKPETEPIVPPGVSYDEVLDAVHQGDLWEEQSESCQGTSRRV